ncbi:MAG: hypothetical protein N4A49_15810 [Marinifilaceae bacterium]|jgi:opacity protein-like surface antigen|nr:hypothetical protein [Marinifilaceae bacterium]
MKKLLFALSLLISASTVFAQKNDIRVGLSASFAKYGYLDHGYTGASTTNFPGLTFQAEKYIQDNISIGAYIGYTAQSFDYHFGINESKYRYFRIGGIFNYDLNDIMDEAGISLPSELTIYASVKAGLNFRSYKYTHHSDPSTGAGKVESKSNDLIVSLGPSIGARYHFVENVAAFTELGWGNAGFFTLGISFDI